MNDDDAGRFVVERRHPDGTLDVYDNRLVRPVRLVPLADGAAPPALAHPNVIAVHGVVQVDGARFVAVDRVGDRGLDLWLAAQRPGWREVAGALAQAGRGLAAAHARGVCHGSFGAAHVYVAEDGRVRVGGFGGGAGGSVAGDRAAFLALARQALAGAPRHRLRLAGAAAIDGLVAALERAAAPRRIPVVALGAVALGAIAVALGITRPLVECERAGDALDAVWDQRARQGFTADVAAQIDGWGARWREAKIAVCREVRTAAATADRRTACLDGALDQLRGVVAREPGSEVSLPVSPATCDGAPPGPRPLRSSRAAAAHLALEEARALYHAGRARDARRLVATIVTAARELGEPTLLGQALVQSASWVVEVDPARARRELAESLLVASQTGDRRLEARARVRQLKLEHRLFAAERTAAMLAAARGAVAAGADRATALELAYVEAELLTSQGRTAELAGACDRVAAHEQPGDEPMALDCLCGLELARNRDAAAAACGAVLDVWLRRGGPLHPQIPLARINVAEGHRVSSQRELARAQLAEAARVAEAALGEGRTLAEALARLGAVEAEAERHAAARPHLERAITIFTAHGGGPTVNLAITHMKLAGVLADLADVAGARRHGAEGMRIAEAAVGADSAWYLNVLLRHGLALMEVDPAGALVALERATPLAGRVRPGSVLHGLVLYGRGHALVELGRAREATAWAAEALRIALTSSSRNNVAHAHFVLGRALLAAGDRGPGRAELAAARAMFVAEGDAAAEVRRIDALLGTRRAR